MLNNKPITSVTPVGLHWIEASAGTGKTFTISSLICRLLLEKYLPNQVIVTTFTRSATAELKVRVRSRLLEVQRFLQTRTSYTKQENIEHAQNLKDELFAVILTFSADKVAFACERLKLILSQLDMLFIGTLDSLSQKILREFAFESGKIERAEITDNAKKYTNQIIHDALRAWIASQPQSVVNLMLASGAIGSVESYTRLVEDTLNFQSAELKEPPTLKLSTDAIAQHSKKLKDFPFCDFEPYFLESGLCFKGVSGTYFKPTSKFTTLFSVAIPALLNACANGDFTKVFSSSFKDHWVLFDSLKKTYTIEKIFSSKCSSTDQAAFYAHQSIKDLIELLDMLNDVKASIDATEAHLKHYLCITAKNQLPAMLQQKRETTFSQQIRNLSESLQGEQGEIFAKAVRNKYPIIIVDEAQDTNQEQDDVLAKIWRDKSHLDNGGMVIVGDRKQAIYGFRGGDMLTFLNAFQDVQSKGGCFYNLDTNYRSIDPLVRAVDSLLQSNPNFGEGVQYLPISASDKPHADLIENGDGNPAPLRWLKLGKGVDAHVQTAQQVRLLLQQAQDGELYFEKNGESTPLIEDDIAILAKNNDDLDKLQYELERIGISVNRGSKRSVFEGLMAQDVAALLQAINAPHDIGRVRRALASSIFGLTVSDLKKLESSADGLGFYLSEFYKVRDTWNRLGFLTAWQQLTQVFPVWENLVTSGAKDSERAVVNLRHIAELLGQFSSKYAGIQSLTQWLLKQVTSPSQRDWELERGLANENGVKLLTIHKSKGLEFKVVFLFKADAAIKEMNKTLNYSTETIENGGVELKKRVIAIGDSSDVSPSDTTQHQERLEAENRRQWYVALTRASHRMYVLLHADKAVHSAVGYWYFSENYRPHENSASEPLVEGWYRYEKPSSEIRQIHAFDMPKHKFFPRKQTSFSGLCQHLSNQQAQDFLVDYYKSGVNIDEFQADIAVEKAGDMPLSFIQKNFPMGAYAGTALHNFLDVIDFTKPDQWNLELYRRFKNGHFPVFAEMLEKYKMSNRGLDDDALTDKMITDLVEWFASITATKIEGELCLGHLPRGAYLSEMPFVLSLKDDIFNSNDVFDLLASYGYIMPELNRAEAARFINGSIDLVYQYRGKFYIGDYKSNHLGFDYACYDHDSMHKNMLQGSYYLQAALYLVALHRYLKKRILGYMPEQHLGGATYMYLRGMQDQKGVFQWCPPIDLILRLDEMLGCHHGQAAI